MNYALSSSSLHISTQFFWASSKPRMEPCFSASQLVDKAPYAIPSADVPKVNKVVKNGSQSGTSHKCFSLMTWKTFRKAMPVARGSPTAATILTSILSVTTCGISSSSSSFLGFSLVGFSFMVAGALLLPNPFALACGWIWCVLLGSDWFWRVVGWRVGLLGFHGKDWERWRDGCEWKIRVFMA